ncbi:20706_t:CDS:2 [Gigaspora rosea]|nr:20706_t:CDS:2 [Gigaspora rosea]
MRSFLEISLSLGGEVMNQVMSRRVSKLSLGGCQALFQIKRKRLCEVSWKTSLGILSKRRLSFRLILSQVMSQRVSKLSLGGCQALFQIKRKRLCEVSWKTSLGILSRRCLSFRLSGLALMSHLTTNNCLRRSIVALAATV